MIERLSEAMGAALVDNDMKIKSDLQRPKIYKTSKPYFSTPELSQCRKSGSMLFWSEPVAASSNCSRLGNALCLCLQVRLAQAVPERGPKSSAIDFAVPLSNPSIVFWKSLGCDCQMTCRGSNVDSNLNPAAWPTDCGGFICSEVPEYTVRS